MNNRNPYRHEELLERTDQTEHRLSRQERPAIAFGLALIVSGAIYYTHMWAIRQLSGYNLAWTWLPATAIAIGTGLAIIAYKLDHGRWKTALLILFIPSFVMLVLALEFVVWPGWI